MISSNSAITREQWALYREEAAARGELILLIPGGQRWYPYFKGDTASTDNHLLRSSWAESSARVATLMLSGLQYASSWHGMLVPEDVLERADWQSLRKAVEAFEFRRNHFDYEQFLVNTLTTSKQNADYPVALAGLLHFVSGYTRLLTRARTQGAEVRTLKQSLVGPTRFEYLLPSMQCVTLLLEQGHRNFHELWDTNDYRKMLAAAHPQVQQFFEAHELVASILSGAISASATAAFYTCCSADHQLVAVQEILDNTSEKNLLKTLPGRFQHYQAEPETVKNRLQRFVGRFNIVDRLRDTVSHRPKREAGYGIPIPELASARGTNWYEMPENERNALCGEIKAREDVLRVAKTRWEKHLAGAISYLTSPVLTWEVQENGCIPQWAVSPAELTAAALQKYEETQVVVIREMQRVARLAVKLRGTTSLVGIKELQRKMSPFTTAAARGKWQQLVDQQRQEILSRQQFRAQKMIEFGFDEATFEKADKEVWLDEILRVEEEVSPYMAYVKKAFQAALPVGATIEFHPYQHRFDGVEFDAQTIQDQDKWLRGNVMKTLRTKRNFATITQVNVFCLDFSRSMNHELMRNLFKVLFLLVSGLEGRDTYDAIHFFGSKFREAVSFTDARGFTSRKVLAKILSHVATVDNGTVLYSGFGGTNISAAVSESHKRIQAFGELLEEELPDARFVKSILVLTDGRPTVGIINIPKLKEYIDQFREEGEVSIKGIYLKDPSEKSSIIAEIFGSMDAVEATSFEELIASFVQTMSLTYRKQRKDYRQRQKRKKMMVDDPEE